MKIRNGVSAFGSIARALHWSMALLIVAALAMG